MIDEKDLKIGETYLYFSASLKSTRPVTYVGRRKDSSFGETFVFRTQDTLNEIWTQNLISISKT